MAKKIGITETLLRDAHQSLLATRMTTEDMLPILEKLDKIGFASLECWGGATYDSCLRFLKTSESFFKVSTEYTAPEGLLGVLINTAFVFGPIMASKASILI